MSEQNHQLWIDLNRRLKAALRRMTGAKVLTGFIWVLLIFGSLWLFLTGLEALLWMSPPFRTVLVAAFALAGLGGIGWWMAWPLFKRPARYEAAQAIGTKFPEVADRLVNFLNLAEGQHSAAPNPLLEAAIQRLGQEVAPVPIEKVETFQEPRRWSKWLIVPFLVLGLFWGLAPSAFVAASKRLLSPTALFERPAAFRFNVSPGHATVVKGASLPISATTYGAKMPIQATLEFKREDESHIDHIALNADSNGRFTHLLGNIRSTLAYRLVADDIASAWYKINVMDRPAVKALTVRISPPSYSGLPNQDLEANVGDVVGLPGTQVSLDLDLATNDVAEATLLFEDGTHQNLTVDGSKAYGSFSIRKDGNYQILLRNAAQVSNESPISYNISTMRDEQPTVTIVTPSPEEVMSESMRELVVARVTDDYGFSKAALCWRLAQRLEGQPMNESKCIGLGLKGHELDQELSYEWLLPETTGLSFKEGDVVEYFVQVWDNNAVSGAQTARSPIHVLKIPSLKEQFKQLEERSDQLDENLNQMQEKSSDLNEMFNELQEQLRRKQAPEWDDQRQLQRMMDEKQRMEQQIQEMKEAMEQMNDMREEQNMADPQTQEMFKEMERVMEEMKTPELMEALRRLQEAMREMNPQKMEQAMQQFKMNEKMFQQRLERLKELLKQLNVNQKLNELSQKAEDLARQEEQMANEIQEMQKDGKLDAKEQQQLENLQDRQQNAKEQMKDLEQKTGELQQDMQDLRNAPKEEMQDLKQEMQQEKLSDQMEQNKQDMKSQKMEQAKQGQKQMQKKLQKMAMQMQQMQQQMQQQQVQLNIEALRRILDDVLTLSNEQETLRNQTRGLSGDNPRLRRLAQQQAELSDGLELVADSLLKLSMRIPKMNAKIQQETIRAQGEMGLAVNMLTERQVDMANGNQKASMTHLNELALLLSELMSQMQQQAGPGSASMQQMMQMLQQMSQQQQQLNQKMQQLLNEMQGDRMSQSQQERMQQMSAQQAAIKKQLDKLMQNPAFRNKVLGDMKKVSEDMDETIREMRQNNVTRQTTFRQQQILNRLLEASRSMNTRGREEKRQSERAKEKEKNAPNALRPLDRNTQIRRDLIRALESGYSPDYERLIKRYFELLQQ